MSHAENPAETMKDRCRNDAKEQENSHATYTKEQKLTAISMALINFSTEVSFAIIAPFFPVEANRKGATSVEVGFIFGVFQLIIFITSPIYGRYINHIGPKFMFISGAFLCGACNIVFGNLDELNNRTTYVLFCFICRSLEANGASMMMTSSFAIMANKFPRNVGSALGILKTFSGVGMAIGPSIGGGLYALGGYKLPFMVVGGIVLLAAFISCKVLPSTQEVTTPTSFVGLLKSPGCIIIYLCTIGSTMSLSAMDPVFSPFMFSKFNLTAGQVGLIFMTHPGVYGLISPLTGYVSDKGWHGSLVVTGCVLVGFSFLLLGPSHLLQWLLPVSLAETICALTLLGVSVSFILVPIFPMVVSLASSLGYQGNIQTYGLIAGFFNSASALGAFVGPSASGYFAHKYDFEWSMTINGFIIISLGFLLLVYIVTKLIYAHCGHKHLPGQNLGPNERTHLLPSSKEDNDQVLY